MTLAVGTRLGPYEILAPLGAGGMGEVYRAGDTRLSREVAVKVLPESLASDSERLKRFEKEAKSASALNHPNIVTIHDIGSEKGVSYIAMELVDGSTLRELLVSGPLPIKKLLQIAPQIAEGLARAHEAGIVHRDLKPENVMIKKDGLVKILDFGLAKLSSTGSGSDASKLPTMTGTQPGVVVGTVSYMSPEQASGQAVDFRSDQFSLGSMLYEMATGKRAFQKKTAIDTLAAILNEEPQQIAVAAAQTPAPLRWIIERCLAKESRQRYASTDDLARDLAGVQGHLSDVSTAAVGVSESEREPEERRRRLALGALGIALFAALGVGLFVWGRGSAGRPEPSFKRITLRRGWVDDARFTPDLQSVVYGAHWGGGPSELFVQRLASADARPLGVRDAEVLGTAGGDALILRYDGTTAGTLARLPLEGGTPRDLLSDIKGASWDRSGTRLEIERAVKGHTRLEYPVGKVLLETQGSEWIGDARLSPSGRMVAIVFHAGPDLSGDVCVLDPTGQKRTLSTGWLDIRSVAWSFDEKEVWFSATKEGFSRELHAVTLQGRERLLAHLPGRMSVRDIAPDGRVLVMYGQFRQELRGRMAGDASERDLSWLDGTALPILAPDGTQMVFQEGGEGGGLEASAYHSRMDGSLPKRLGDGTPWDVSPDWKTALVGVGLGENIELKLVPIGAGEASSLPRGSIRHYRYSGWNPGGKRIVIAGTGAEKRQRLYVQDVAGGLPRPLTNEVAEFMPFSPAGDFIAVKLIEDGPWLLQPIDGGEPRPLAFVKPAERPIVFSDDGKSVFVLSVEMRLEFGTFPIHIVRVDLRTGKRDSWLELSPADRAGAMGTTGVALTPNGRYYAYGYQRLLADLYLIEGLK